MLNVSIKRIYSSKWFPLYVIILYVLSIVVQSILFPILQVSFEAIPFVFLNFFLLPFSLILIYFHFRKDAKAKQIFGTIILVGYICELLLLVSIIRGHIDYLW